jgi:hypothetical protein
MPCNSRVTGFQPLTSKIRWPCRSPLREACHRPRTVTSHGRPPAARKIPAMGIPHRCKIGLGLPIEELHVYNHAAGTRELEEGLVGQFVRIRDGRKVIQ